MKIKQLIIGIINILVGIGICFLQLVPDVPDWLFCLGIPITCLGIFLTVYSFNWSKKERSYNKEPLTLIKEDEIIDYFNSFLPNTPDKILKIYCSEDRKQRAYIYRREDCTVSIKKEVLELYDSEEICMMQSYGYWYPAEGGGIYDTVETAIKENAHILKNMEEIDISSLREIK